MRAITLLTAMVVAISLLTGIAIGLHHQHQDQDQFAADAAAFIAAAKAVK